MTMDPSTLDGGDRADGGAAVASIASVASVAESDPGQGALWSRETEDLDVNVVAFSAGGGVEEHVNGEVDVLVVVLSGNGQARVGDIGYPLAAGTALLIPKGVARAIRCTEGRLVYVSCHRRRRGLMPAALPMARA
jgi:quercetin dioxygenase-like cupin family protein